MSMDFFSSPTGRREYIEDADPINAALRSAAALYLYEIRRELMTRDPALPAPTDAAQIEGVLRVALGLVEALREREGNDEAAWEAKEAPKKKKHRAAGKAGVKAEPAVLKN